MSIIISSYKLVISYNIDRIIIIVQFQPKYVTTLS